MIDRFRLAGSRWCARSAQRQGGQSAQQDRSGRSPEVLGLSAAQAFARPAAPRLRPGRGPISIGSCSRGWSRKASSPWPTPIAPTLLRRVTFDLTGLPPTPEEILTFVTDESPEALATVVDRLLASPRFGERWGRHWLDVVRYGESTGKDRNIPYRYAWRYRDYVIDAFNRWQAVQPLHHRATGRRPAPCKERRRCTIDWSSPPACWRLVPKG